MSTSNPKSGLARVARSFTAAIAVLTIVGCSSTKDYTQEYGDRLALSDNTFVSGDLAKSNEQTTQLIDDMEERGVEGYEVQRAVAEALLVAIHMSASRQNGFLTEPGRFEFSLDATGSGNRVASETAHRVAAIFHAWRLLEREPTLAAAAPAAAAPAAADDLIAPGRLSRLLGPGRTKNFAWLNIAGAFAQLGFDDRSRGILRKIEHPVHGFVFTNDSPDADILMVEVMTDLGLPRGLQWYLFAMGHEVHKQTFEDLKRTTDPTLAYRLGCLAAFGPLQPVGEEGLMRHSGEVADPEWKDDFYLWIEDLKGSNGTFESSEGEIMSTGVIASREGEPAIDFEWTPIE